MDTNDEQPAAANAPEPTTNATVPTPEPISAPVPVPPTEAVTTPPVSTASGNVGSAAAVPQHSSPVTLILQWLTYAFWGWTVLIMSFLTFTVLATFILKRSSFDWAVQYVVASILVLLPASLITDYIYMKREPAKKTGVAAAIMIIHAVIFALFAMAALIGMMFSLVSMLTGTDTSNNVVALLSSLIILLLYVAVLVRTLRPAKPVWFGKAFLLLMIVIVGVIAILGIIGPVAQARAARDDAVVDSAITPISSQISAYAIAHRMLPPSLDTLALGGDASKAVGQHLLEYKPNTQPSAGGDYPATQAYGNTIYYYQLCVNYKTAGASWDGSSNRTDSGPYTMYADTGQHGPGPYCYNLETSL